MVTRSSKPADPHIGFLRIVECSRLYSPRLGLTAQPQFSVFTLNSSRPVFRYLQRSALLVFSILCLRIHISLSFFLSALPAHQEVVILVNHQTYPHTRGEYSLPITHFSHPASICKTLSTDINDVYMRIEVVGTDSET